MVGHEAFLAEIAASPNDDGPRLIYADWLVERGDPLGEFIHTQCMLDSMAEWEPEHAELKRRERELLAQHGRTWAGDLRRHGMTDIRFRRGFVDEIGITVSHLVRMQLGIFVGAPWLRSLCVRQAAAMTPALAGCELLERVESLSLRDNKLDNEHLDRLTFSPFIGKLQALDLSVNEIATVGVHHLAALRELRVLKLENNLLGAPAAQVIARKDSFASLISLSLRGNRISMEGVAALARSPQLNLSDNRITDAGVNALLASEQLSRLRLLDVRENPISESGHEALKEAFGQRVYV